MAETGITCKTFCERLYKCSYYKESNDYVRTSRLLFERILKKYKQSDSTLYELFSNEFTNRSFTGIRSIYSDDRISYKNFCIACIANLNTFFEKFKPTHILDKYKYRHKIKGKIGCRIKNYNVQFFFENIEECKKELDFACLNNYIYNQVNNLTNSSLIMSVPTDGFFIVRYNEPDYTIGRGFFGQTKKNKSRRRGDHCKRCIHKCNALFLNGLDRMEAHLW